jgi:AcrR family transcriptional regulator
MPMAVGHGDGTRSRILELAMRLFTSKGYAGTSIADITTELGMSKAALYHHFSAKSEILEELVAGPLAAFARLAEHATTGRQTPEQLLTALIDTAATARPITIMISDDPSAQEVLNRRAERQHPQQINDALVHALAGPHPTPGATVRAHSALAIAKQGTLAVMGTGGGALEPARRAELLAAALRALRG